MKKVNPVANRQNHSLLGFGPKKLRRLPHVFSRVLELPFKSDAEVSIFETPNCFRFVAKTHGVCHGFRAHTVRIHPGVTKVVITRTQALEFTLDQLELDMWRFRLPESTLPELATAAFAAGKLVVTVPKTVVPGEAAWGGFNGEGRLVVVQ